MRCCYKLEVDTSGRKKRLHVDVLRFRAPSKYPAPALSVMQAQRIGPALIPIGSRPEYAACKLQACQTPNQSMSSQIHVSPDPCPSQVSKSPVRCHASSTRPPPPPGPEWPVYLQKETNCNRPGRAAASLGSPLRLRPFSDWQPAASSRDGGNISGRRCGRRRQS